MKTLSFQSSVGRWKRGCIYGVPGHQSRRNNHSVEIEEEYEQSSGKEIQTALRWANCREQTLFFMDRQSRHLKWDEAPAMSVGKAVCLSVAGENVYNCWGEWFTKCGGLNVSLPQSSAFEHLLLSWWNCFGEAWRFWRKRSLPASFEGWRALSTLGSLTTYKSRCGGTCFPWLHRKPGLDIWDPIFKTSVIYLGAYFRSY